MIARPPLYRIALLLSLTLACGTIAFAAPPPAPSGGLATPDYKIETNATHSNFNTGDFTMPGKVRFYRPGTDAVGDRAEGNFKKGTAILIGDVVVHDSGNAPEAGGTSASYSGSGPATLTCDRLEIDSKSKLYTAIGHVHFMQGNRSGSSDRAVLNRNNGTLHMEGSVHLSENGSTLSADVVDYNLNTKDVDVQGGPAVITQPANQPPNQPSPSPTPKPRKR